MPHGGGHVVGDGGFHGGGGFHHHHHHSSSIFVGPPILWWGYGWRSPYYWEARAWGRVLAALAVVVVIVLVVGAVAARYGNNTVSPSYLSPGDTRLLAPSSTFCEGTYLANHASVVTASAYLLRSKPALSARNNFSVASSFSVMYREYQYWSFYLYPGSAYTFTSCLQSGSVYYYVIKGKSNFDNWVRSPYGYDYVLYSNQCGGTNRTGGQTFLAEDEYYFVLYNSFYTTTSVRMTLAFNRVEYEPQSGGVVDSCTAPPTSSCSVAIPYGSDYWLLVGTSPPLDGNQWDANVNVGTSCSARVWVYVVLVLVPLMGVVLMVGTTVGVCCCVKRLSLGYQTLPRTTTSSSTTTTTTNTSNAPAAPSYPKMYTEPPPPYSGPSAPPLYQ